LQPPRNSGTVSVHPVTRNPNRHSTSLSDASAVDLASIHKKKRPLFTIVTPVLHDRAHRAELLGAHNALAFYTKTAVQPAKLTRPIGDENCVKCHQNVLPNRNMNNHFTFPSKMAVDGPNAATVSVAIRTFKPPGIPKPCSESGDDPGPNVILSQTLGAAMKQRLNGMFRAGYFGWVGGSTFQRRIASSGARRDARSARTQRLLYEYFSSNSVMDTWIFPGTSFVDISA